MASEPSQLRLNVIVNETMYDHGDNNFEAFDHPVPEPDDHSSSASASKRSNDGPQAGHKKKQSRLDLRSPSPEQSLSSLPSMPVGHYDAGMNSSIAVPQKDVKNYFFGNRIQELGVLTYENIQEQLASPTTTERQKMLFKMFLEAKTEACKTYHFKNFQKPVSYPQADTLIEQTHGPDYDHGLDYAQMEGQLSASFDAMMQKLARALQASTNQTINSIARMVASENKAEEKALKLAEKQAAKKQKEQQDAIHAKIMQIATAHHQGKKEVFDKAKVAVNSMKASAKNGTPSEDNGQSFLERKLANAKKELTHVIKIVGSDDEDSASEEVDQEPEHIAEINELLGFSSHHLIEKDSQELLTYAKKLLRNAIHLDKEKKQRAILDLAVSAIFFAMADIPSDLEVTAASNELYSVLAYILKAKSSDSCSDKNKEVTLKATDNIKAYARTYIEGARSDKQQEFRKRTIDNLLEEVQLEPENGFNISALILSRFDPNGNETPATYLQHAFDNNLATVYYSFAKAIVSEVHSVGLSTVPAIAVLLLNSPKAGQLALKMRTAKKPTLSLEMAKQLFDSRKADATESWAEFTNLITKLFCIMKAEQPEEDMMINDEWTLQLMRKTVPSLKVNVIAKDISLPRMVVKNVPAKGIYKPGVKMMATLHVPVNQEINVLEDEVAAKIKSSSTFSWKELVLTKH